METAILSEIDFCTFACTFFRRSLPQFVIATFSAPAVPKVDALNFILKSESELHSGLLYLPLHLYLLEMKPDVFVFLCKVVFYLNFRFKFNITHVV